MAKIPKLIEMLGALGGKFVPESDLDRGALGEFMDKKIEDARNTPFQPPANVNLREGGLPTQKKIDITNEAMKMIDLSEANPFQLLEDVEGYQFVNKTLMNELSKAIEMNNYDDAKKYMNTIQDKYEKFGAGTKDFEATNLIDTILEEVFMEGM